MNARLHLLKNKSTWQMRSFAKFAPKKVQLRAPDGVPYTFGISYDFSKKEPKFPPRGGQFAPGRGFERRGYRRPIPLFCSKKSLKKVPQKSLVTPPAIETLKVPMFLSCFGREGLLKRRSGRISTLIPKVPFLLMLVRLG